MSPPSSQPLVLVTGGSGFLAGHCLLQLHRSGYRLRATLRSLDRAAAQSEVLGRAAGKPVPVEWFAADLRSEAGWREAMAGADYVLHVASPLPRKTPRNASELIGPARDGTVRVLRAAAEAGVRRAVMTSSTAAITYGRGDLGRPFTEADWSDPDDPDNSPYTRSKFYAEKAAWDFMAQDRSGMEFVTINPGVILGPVLEQDYGTSAEIVLKLLKGDLPGMPPLGFPLVDVRDVAAAHVCALTHPQAAGERFLCAGDFMWVGEMAAVLREHLPALARRMPARRVPGWVLRAVALFDPVTRSVVFELGKERRCDAAKLRTVLGVTLRPIRETIIATADSLRAHGLV